jgi:hypothetical protein
LAIDLIGLGMHLADAVNSPFASDTPSRAKVTVGGPEAVVPGSAGLGSQTAHRTKLSDQPQAAQPYGCLALNSGCYAGPPPSAGPTPNGGGGGTTTPPPSAPGTSPVPVAQVDASVPDLGAQLSVGVGDGGCTGVNLTVIAIGNCPAAQGEGPVILHLGGSLLGQ